MRIAVAIPPLRDFYLSPHRMSALGARTLVRLLEKAGHTIVSPENTAVPEQGEPFIFPLMGFPSRLPLPREAAHLSEWLLPEESGPLSFFTGFKRFGPGWDRAAGVVAREEPQAVFVSSFAYAYAEDAVLFAAALRRLRPGVLIVAGGAGPSSWPDYYLSPPAGLCGPAGPVFDAVFTGEAEAGLPLLLDFLSKRLSAGGSGAAGGQCVLIRAPALSSAEDLPCVFAIHRQTREKVWLSTVLSRGCPMGCRFCSAQLCHGRQFRATPIKEISAGLDRLPRELAEKQVHINIEDDNFLVDKAWFGEALRIFRERFPRASFSAENGVDYRLLDSAGLDQLIAAGFDRFNISIAATCARTAAMQSRQTDLARYLALARRIAEKNIPLVSYFIAGLEDCCAETIVRDISFLAGSPGIAGISLFYPVPGIAGFERPPEILRNHTVLALGSFAWPWTGSLGTGELITAFRLTRLANLAKKPRLNGIEEELLGRCIAEKRLFTLCRGTGKSGAGKMPRIAAAPADKNMVELFFKTSGVF